MSTDLSNDNILIIDIPKDGFDQIPEDSTEEKQITTEAQQEQSLQDWVNALEEEYGPASVGFSNNGFQTPIRLYGKLPSHDAAARGDINFFKYLNIDVNVADTADRTPLHIATYKNNLPLIKCLLNKGANINAIAYDKYSPLSLALKYNHMDLVNFYLSQPNIAVQAKALEIALNRVNEKVLEYNQQPFTEKQASIINQDLKSVLSLAKKMEIPLTEGIDPLPASILLELIANGTAHVALQDIIISFAQKIQAFDSSHQTYIYNKLLTHLFEIKGQYPIHYQTSKESHDTTVIMNAEGLVGSYTIDFARHNVIQYIKQNSERLDKHTIDNFDKINQILSNSYNVSLHSEMSDTFFKVYNELQDGQIVLLKSGWLGHFIINIIDLKNGYFMVANSGEAFEKFTPGIQMYKIGQPEKLTPELLHKITTNEEQFDSEMGLLFELGLTPVLDLFETSQHVGNCSWRSVEISIKALLFLESINQGLDIQQAADYATYHYNEWHDFAKLNFLEQYLEHEFSCESDLLYDILLSNHQSFFDEELPMNHSELASAKIIIGALTSSEYKEQFIEKLAMDKHLFYEAKPEFINLFQQAGINLPDVKASQPNTAQQDLILLADGKQPEQQLEYNEVIQEQYGGYQNLGYQQHLAQISGSSFSDITNTMHEIDCF